MIFIVMGVSGCGKSTVGEELSKKLSIPFFDADDFHPSSNIKKMSSGIPLTDDDRKPWLTLLASKIYEWQVDGGAVLACSALKECYRSILSSQTESGVVYIYLKGDKALLSSRLQDRESHFMPETLLDSQLQTLEPPLEGITVSIDNTLEEIISLILKEV